MTLEELLSFCRKIRQLDDNISLAEVHLLLVVATKGQEGISLTDLCQTIGIGAASGSRYVAALGSVSGGLELLEAFENPIERRRKIIRLSHKGKLLLTKFFKG